MVILKIDKGLTERLMEIKELKEQQARNLKGEELTLNLADNDVVIEVHKDGLKNYLEISDINGSFGLWIELTKNKFDKIKHIVRMLAP